MAVFFCCSPDTDEYSSVHLAFRIIDVRTLSDVVIEIVAVLS